MSCPTNDLPILRTTYYTRIPKSDPNRNPDARMKHYLAGCREFIFTYLEQNYTAHEDRDLGNIELLKTQGVGQLHNYSIEDLCDLVQSSKVEANPKFRISLEDSASQLQKGTLVVGRETFIRRLTNFDYLEKVTEYCAMNLKKV